MGIIYKIWYRVLIPLREPHSRRHRFKRVGFMSDSSSSHVVRLRNGANCNKAVADALLEKLVGFVEQEPMAFYELVMACRDWRYPIVDEESRDILIKQKFIKSFDATGNARIDNDTRNLVASAVLGNGRHMHIVPPFAR